jgi:hypothetical protein
LRTLKIFFIAFIGLSSFSLLVTGLCASAIENNSEFLDYGDSNFISTFSIVRDCESYGSDVSSFISSLNVCADYLSEAHILYESGNISGSVYYVNACSNILENIKSDALSLREKSMNDLYLENGLTIFKSFAAIIVIVIFGLVVWRIISFPNSDKVGTNRGMK